MDLIHLYYTFTLVYNFSFDFYAKIYLVYICI